MPRIEASISETELIERWIVENGGVKEHECSSAVVYSIGRESREAAEPVAIIKGAAANDIILSDRISTRLDTAGLIGNLTTEDLDRADRIEIKVMEEATREIQAQGTH